MYINAQKKKVYLAFTSLVAQSMEIISLEFTQAITDLLICCWI